MLKGSCLCGEVQYEITANISGLSHCHCTQCQKAHGAAFGTYARTDKRAYRFTQGEENVSLYRSSKNVARSFCGVCGSTLQFIDGNTPFVNFTIATLDAPINASVNVEIWCSEKAHWLEPSQPMESHDKNA